MENKKRIYYAHSMLLYGSQIEHDDIKTLESLGFEVLNPNHPTNEENYLKNNAFGIFLDLVRTCDGVAFRTVMGKITSGTGKELQYAKEHKMPIIELPYITSDRFLSLEETNEYLRPLNVKD